MMFCLTAMSVKLAIFNLIMLADDDPPEGGCSLDNELKISEAKPRL
jgi:hypothetical protein